MATKWKKYEMYGPEKPGRIKRWFWHWKDKLKTMNGLYVLSVVFLVAFTDLFIRWMDFDYSMALTVYLFGILNIIIWGVLLRKIDGNTDKPFFMNWLKKWDCDILILLYGAVLCVLLIVTAIGAGYFIRTYYDWDGYYAYTDFMDGSFMVLFTPIAMVNNAFVMVIIRHLKSPELRKNVFCRRLFGKVRHWFKERRLRYQRKYPFQQKIQMEMIIIFCVLIMVGGLSLLSVVSYGMVKIAVALLILIGSVIVFVWLYNHKSFMNDVGTLVNEIHEVSEGNTLKESAIPEHSFIYEAGRDLTNVYKNLNDSVKRQVRSEKMKVDLITNVSHDLKTPLTSIIGYIDLLKKTELSDEARDYVDILSKKSERLKYMIQEVFEISKATSGNMDLHIEMLDIGTLIYQILGDMEENIESSHRIIRKQISEEPLYVLSDSQKMYRIYQNLIENALKYSLEGSRIFIDTFGDERKVTTIIKNTSSYEMDFTEETITERFTRGDTSRTTEGHGLGLAIVKSFAEACGGEFHIDIDGDLFKAIVVFKREFPEMDNIG
ncbi:MAG: HAMP domain-containing sensor histidine kinase [Frisingicoccus sp.]|nr:HAMP domain-containing sensor histidine kinase [Frisingicoccus sp.]